MRLPDANDQIKRAPVRALRAVFSGVGQLLLAADRLREEDARGNHESDDDQPDTLASWDGRLSSSVRLITHTETPAQSPDGAGSAPGDEPAPTERQAKLPAGKPGKSAAGKARPAGSTPTERPRKASAPATRGGKNVADAKRATKAKAGSPAARKSGRPKDIAEPPRFRSLDLTGNVRMLTDQDVADLASDQFAQSAFDAQAVGPPSAQPAAVREQPSSVLAAETAAPVWSQAAPSWSSWSTSAAEVPEVTPPVASLPINGYEALSLASLRARLRNLDTAELTGLLAHERSHANREDVVTMFERRIAKLEQSAS